MVLVCPILKASTRSALFNCPDVSGGGEVTRRMLSIPTSASPIVPGLFRVGAAASDSRKLVRRVPEYSCGGVRTVGILIDGWSIKTRSAVFVYTKCKNVHLILLS